jgi:polyhydroxybutyrate depolymerase
MALFCLALAATACSSSATTAATASSSLASPPTSSAATRSVATRSSGCGQPASAGTETLTPSIDGTGRTVIVHLPRGYAATTGTALVLNLHGSRSTALEQEALTGMNATADAEGFIVAYPQGGVPAPGGFEWNVPGEPLVGGAAVPAAAPDDVAFLEQLVGLLERSYCIDPREVFATGFSGGARMASQLACDASTLVAAVAPVSGLRYPTPCPSGRAVPVLAFHGTADPVDPYLGNGQAYWTYSVPVAAQRWAAHNRCASAPSRAEPDPGVALTRYGSCESAADVALYSITGEGHEWPGGPPLPRRITRALGPQTTAISANATMWSFFTAHPLP